MAQRDEAVTRFRTGQTWFLVCTDSMSRGLDFPAVQVVINYDFPQSTISYVHRIGRAGRAGRRGEAITLFTEDDYPALRGVANIIKLSGGEVQDWMLKVRNEPARSERRGAKGEGYDLESLSALLTPLSLSRRSSRRRGIATKRRGRLEAPGEEDRKQDDDWFN